MATRCPRCGKWIKENRDECPQCGFALGKKRSYGKSNVTSNPFG